MSKYVIADASGTLIGVFTNKTRVYDAIIAHAGDRASELVFHRGEKHVRFTYAAVVTLFGAQNMVSVYYNKEGVYYDKERAFRVWECVENEMFVLTCND